jgi:hypothetical protein
MPNIETATKQLRHAHEQLELTRQYPGRLPAKHRQPVKLFTWPYSASFYKK